MSSSKTSPKGVVYAIANQKGGVGKTTITEHLAIGLANLGKQVLVVDVDPQANSSTFFLFEPDLFYGHPSSVDKTLRITIIHKQPLPVFPSRYENIDIVPSSLDLSTADRELASSEGLYHNRLKKRLDEIKDKYDYVLLDCPPSLSCIMVNALVAADRLVVIVNMGIDSLSGVDQLERTINDLILNDFEHKVDFRGFLINGALRTSIAYRNIRDTLDKRFPKKAYSTFIPYRVGVESAKVRGTSMLEGEPNDYAMAMRKFIKEEFNL